jgi:peptidoglycan/xylan/chitin deacetylase (PgdA/CDA1 family)
MNPLHSRHVFRYVSRHLVCQVPLRQRRIALTFDDGPNPELTPRLLHLLDAHQAKATFFLIGRNVQRWPHLAAEIVHRGHEVGNHSQNHLLLPLLPQRLLLREMHRADSAIHAATGLRPRLFRPPMGWFNRRMLRTLAEHGYQPVLGDVYPQDTTRPGTGVIVERILARVAPGSIVILHDGSLMRADRTQSIDAIAAALPRLIGDGWTMGTVSELFAAADAESRADDDALTSAGR